MNFCKISNFYEIKALDQILTIAQVWQWNHISKHVRRPVSLEDHDTNSSGDDDYRPLIFSTSYPRVPTNPAGKNATMEEEQIDDK